MSSSRIRKWLPLALVSVAVAVPAVACGPFFPNQLLFHAGDSVTWAPVADFRREIERIHPEASIPRAVVPEKDDPYQQTAAIDLADLREALDAAHVLRDRRDSLLTGYEAFRQAVTAHERRVADEKGKGPETRPAVFDATVPDGMPAEFAAYVRGLVCYHRSQMPEARSAWAELFRLPAEQRRYRTVWAQFMIGKSYLGRDGPRAAEAFARVRELVKAGARDSLGLACASLGWEARAELDQRHYARAIRLYLEQHSSGDPTAIQSLAVVCGSIFRRDDSQLLQQLAADPPSARALTAYALAQGGPFRARPDGGVVRRWLAAVESAGSGPLVGAERLAWSAYQQGDMAAAGRWLRKSPDAAPIALWVQAKLRCVPASRSVPPRCWRARRGRSPKMNDGWALPERMSRGKRFPVWVSRLRIAPTPNWASCNYPAGNTSMRWTIY